MAVLCKPKTAQQCRHNLNKHLLPKLGTLRLDDITPGHVAALHYGLREMPIMRNQVIEMLSRLFNKAEVSGYVPPDGNPCRFIKKYPTWSCERFLSEREFVRLGTVLNELEANGKISSTAPDARLPADAGRCRSRPGQVHKLQHRDRLVANARLRPGRGGARTPRRALTAPRLGRRTLGRSCTAVPTPGHSVNLDFSEWGDAFPTDCSAPLPSAGSATAPTA